MKRIAIILFPFLENGLILYLVWYGYKTSENQWYLVFLFFPLKYLYVYIKALWGKFKNIKNESYILDNNKVVALVGGQRRGKTSFMQYLVSKTEQPHNSYSNVPFEINGKMTKVLLAEHINMRYKLKEYSNVMFDEIILYYHNLENLRDEEVVYFETILQLLGHFTDGHVFFTSVNLRIPSRLKDKVNSYINMKGRRRLKYSMFWWLWKKIGIDLSFSVWDYIITDRIPDDIGQQYYYDLSNVDNDTIRSSFASSMSSYSWNAFDSYKYDDRFFYAIYSDLPVYEERFKEISLSARDLDDLGFRRLKEMKRIAVADNKARNRVDYIEKGEEE